MQAALDSFIDSTFSPSNYSAGACLARDVDGNPLVALPDAFGRQVKLFLKQSRCSVPLLLLLFSIYLLRGNEITPSSDACLFLL